MTVVVCIDYGVTRVCVTSSMHAVMCLCSHIRCFTVTCYMTGASCLHDTCLTLNDFSLFVLHGMHVFPHVMCFLVLLTCVS